MGKGKQHGGCKSCKMTCKICFIWHHTKTLYCLKVLQHLWGPFTNTCKGGLMQKGGPLNFLTLVRGAPKKITTDFPLKIEFTCFSMGLTCNFHGKKGGPEFFCGLKGGGGWKIFAKKIFFALGPPCKYLWTVPWSHGIMKIQDILKVFKLGSDIQRVSIKVHH